MKILEIVGEIGGGGVGSVLYNYISHMDCKVFLFDILVFEGDAGIHKSDITKFEQLGCNVLTVKHRNKGYVKHFVEIYKIISQGNYDAVHCHLGEWSTPYLYIAKIKNVKKRIAHVHTSQNEYSGYKKILLTFFKRSLNKVVTHKVACGEKARNFFWKKNDDVYIMRNAIPLEEYAYSEGERKQVRKELDIDGDSFVVAHVGRFNFPKNQKFILDIAKEFKTTEGTIFVLVGEGEDRLSIMKCAIDRELPIIFTGFRSDVKRLLNAMDLFILPSFYEGLPVSLLEAEANGLPSIISDKISNEVCFFRDTVSLPIDQLDSAEQWAMKIRLLANERKRRKYRECYDVLTANGYNIREESKRLERFYVH